MSDNSLYHSLCWVRSKSVHVEGGAVLVHLENGMISEDIADET